MRPSRDPGRLQNAAESGCLRGNVGNTAMIFACRLPFHSRSKSLPGQSHSDNQLPVTYHYRPFIVIRSNVDNDRRGWSTTGGRLYTHIARLRRQHSQPSFVISGRRAPVYLPEYVCHIPFRCTQGIRHI